jgi:HSP20 family protein
MTPALEDPIERLFEEFRRDFGAEPWGVETERMRAYTPRVDVMEDDHNVTVRAELPGLEMKDIEVTLSRNTLHLKGEKKVETEEKEKEFYRRECSYGTFYRQIPLPVDVDSEKTKAHFKSGILTVVLPKSKEEVEAHKKIDIKAG